jgi:hypothetical protein
VKPPAAKWVGSCLWEFPMEEAYQQFQNNKGSLWKMFAVIRLVSKRFIDFLLSARISATVINSEKLLR